MPLFPNLPIIIEDKFVYQLLGYRKKSTVIPDRIRDAVRRELAISRELLRFRGIYHKFAITAIDHQVQLVNGYIITSRKLSDWIQNCTQLYLFVVTAGILFSERTAELLSRDEISAAMIADAAGSAAAESCAQAADEYLRTLEPGSRLSKRYSPGYGDWDVADNRNFLRYVNAEEIGITVNEGGLMRPEKSVSAAIGIKIP